MVYFVYFIVVISFLDTFSQLPIISPYAQQLGAGPLLMGLIVGMYSFTNMLGNILAGQWLDQFGRKKIMFMGMLLAGGSLGLYSFVTTANQLIWVRFLHGIGGGLLIPAVFTFLGDRSGSGRQGRSMALSGAAIGISAILGPAFGGIVKAYLGVEFVFWIVASLLIVTAGCVLLWLPETYTKSGGQNFSLSKWLELLRHQPLIRAYLSSFGLMFTLGILTYALPLKVELLGFNSAATGMLMSIYGIVAIIMFVLPTNRISDRVGRIKPMLTGLFVIGCALVCLGFFTRLPFLFGAMALYGIGFALLFPAMTALVVDHTEDTDRGKAFGLFYAFFSLGVVVGPFVVGLIGASPDMGMFIGALGVLFILVLHLIIHHSTNRKTS